MSLSTDTNVMKDEDAHNDVPLCVDLDGTLLRTDTLVESFIALLRQNFLLALLVPVWLLRGKANLKEQIARHIDLDISLLPPNEEFLVFLKRQHSERRRLVLTTAANRKYAQSVAEHFGLFDMTLSSDSNNNLSADKKLERLRQEFGDCGFDYAGNSMDDVRVLSAARQAILVAPERGVAKAVVGSANVVGTYDRKEKGAFTYLRAIRLHQWLKNLLLFLPLLASHRFSDVELLGKLGLAFLAFSLCASSVYVLNDLVDLSADRAHPRKRDRPFASGQLPLIHGVLMVPLLLGGALLIAWMLPVAFVYVLGLYFALTLAYSIKLKLVVLVDVLTLAGLYTMRVIAGSAAGSIVPSFWLLAFSMFLFLSLATVKRYTELLEYAKVNKGKTKVRGYSVSDMEILRSFGVASGYLAVLVLALYINSSDVANNFNHPQMIWLLCPLLLYWISRVWLLAARNRMHDDPVIFAVKDWVSRMIVVIVVFIVWLASLSVDIPGFA